MPAQITHILIAEHALKSLTASFVSETAVPAWLTENKNLFYLGCQGPDIFYHNQITRPLAIEYGSLLHRRDYGVFCANAFRWFFKQKFCFSDEVALSSFKSKKFLAYLLGFITHAIVDRIFHPFIVYVSFFTQKSSTQIPSGKFHAFYERILDFLILNFLEKKTTHDFDTSQYLKISAEEVEILTTMFSSVLLETYPSRLASDNCMKERLKNAYLDSIWFYKITNPIKSSTYENSFYVKELCKEKNLFATSAENEKMDWSLVSLLFPDSLTSGVDWFNDEHRVWKNPSLGTSYSESLKDLAFFSIEKTKKLIQWFLDFVKGDFDFLQNTLQYEIFQRDFLEEFSKNVGDASLSLIDECGKPGLPKFTNSAFFPLDLEIQRQIDLRLDWW